MPLNMTLNGVAFASPSVPGYTPGMRVVVDAAFVVSDAQVLAIDGAKGAEVVLTLTPTSVTYKTDKGLTLSSGALVSVPVKFHSLQRRTVTRQRLVSASIAGAHYAGGAYCTSFVLVGTGAIEDLAPSAPPSPDVGGLYGRYYNNSDLIGLPAWVGKEVPGFRLGATPPKAGVNELFSARWTGFIRVPSAGKWQIEMECDDGSNLWFQGLQAVNKYGGAPGVYQTGWLDLSAGVDYAIWVEYVNTRPPWAVLYLYWRKQNLDGTPGTLELIPGSAMYASLPNEPAQTIEITTGHFVTPVTRY